MHQPIKYPTELAPRQDVVEEFTATDGSVIKVSDPYRALEDPDAEGTKAWVQAQNVLTQEYLSTCDLRDKLVQKMGELQSFAKMTVPHKHGDHYFFSYNTGLQNQAIIYKIEAPDTFITNEDNPLEGTKLFLDPNTLAEDGTAALRKTVYSLDGKHMAYQVSRGGSDWVEIYIKNCETNEDLTDHLMWVKFSQVSWTLDNLGFFYSKYDAPKTFENQDMDKAGTEIDQDSAQKVFYHRLGTSQDQDVLIYEKPEEPLAVYFTQMSSCGKYLMNNVGGDCDDELFTITYADISEENMDKPIAFKMLSTKLPGKGMSFIHNIGTKFYFRSSHGCSLYKIICVDLEKPEEENWVDIVPEHNANVLQEAHCVNDLMVVSYMENVSDKLVVYDFQGNFVNDIQLPGIGSALGRASGKYFIFKFTSFTDPGSINVVDMDSFEVKKIASTKMGGSINMDDFKTDQIWYPGKDGVQIPMFVVRKISTLPTMDTVPEKPIVTMLYGYGGFNVSITPAFSANRLALLNNLGGMLVIATLRGGGEFGEEWHAQGMLDKKQTCFDDFIAAAEFLIEKKYTSPEKLHINGASNGGLLVTTCVNQRPDLFAGGIAQVPVTDMIRFQKFTCGYQWCGDYGNAEKGDADWQIKFSPVHNVKPQIYPALLVTTADHDDRVVPLHTFKFMAEVQHQAGSIEGQRPLLTRIDVNAGHGGGMPTAKIIQLYADIFGFIAKVSNAEWNE